MTIIGDYIEPATTHTAGPWDSAAGREIDLTPRAGTAYRINTIEIRSYVERGTWKTLAFIPADEPEAQANARCIAAAPAQGIILDLLRHGLATIAEGDLEFDGVMYWFDDSCPDWAAVVNAIGWDHARAAIAKVGRRAA